MLDVSAVPLIDDAAIRSYVAQGCVPGGTNRNYAAYGHRISALTDEQSAVLCDSQTSGGLLVSVDPSHVDAFVAVCAQNNTMSATPTLLINPLGNKHVCVARALVIAIARPYDGLAIG